MNKSIQALREQRTALAKDLRNMLETNPGDKWNADLQAKYDGSMAQIDNIDGEMTRINDTLEKLKDEHVESAIIEVGNRVQKDAKTPAAQMYAKWLRGGDNALNAAEWADIRATMSTTTGSEGGYSVQSDIASRLIESLKSFGGMREAADVITTDMGNPLSFPTTDGTSETGELIGENTTATAADPTFGTVALNAYKFSSKIVAVPFELLQDSQINVEDFVNSRCATRIGRVTNTFFTTGTGSAQPRGAVTASTAGKVGTTGQTLTVIFDDLVDLVHSVDPAYRSNPGVRFMMNDSSLKVIRKIKDSQGRPIFIPGYDGLGGAMPDTILGYPVTINQDVANMAANAKSILFGDFKKYVIRDVMDATMFRFADSAYVKLGQIGFLMWSRSGGNLLDTAAVKYYQNSAT